MTVAENIDELINYIRKSKTFHMAWWSGWTVTGENAKRGDCPNCIGGHAHYLWFKNKGSKTIYGGNILPHISGKLGLSKRDADALFYPRSIPTFNVWYATAEQAIKVLEHLKATGKVDWNAAWRDDGWLKGETD